MTSEMNGNSSSISEETTDHVASEESRASEPAPENADSSESKKPKRAYGFGLIDLIIVSIIVLVLAMIPLPSHLEAPVRAAVSRVKSDQRALSTALEAYLVDHGAYPVPALLHEYGDDDDALIEAGGYALGTVPMGFGNFGATQGLTTPMNYLTASYYRGQDPFSPGEEYPHTYATNGESWLLISPGPDQKYDIDPKRDVDWSLNIADFHESIRLLNFDPTNGMTSYGDITRIRD